MNPIVTVIISGVFTLSGVILGCVLSEVCAARHARPALCFKLSATPDNELTEVGLRTKTSASEYSITIYNYGQRPFLLERIEFYYKKHLLIDYVLTDDDLTIMPYQYRSFILDQQHAKAMERHCMEKDIKECLVVATGVNSKRVRSKLDISWIHMRATWQNADFSAGV